MAFAVAKSLARHSTITLTMNHYTHTFIEDERSALARWPGVGRRVSQRNTTEPRAPTPHGLPLDSSDKEACLRPRERSVLALPSPDQESKTPRTGSGT
jgi:hypothetical protein